MVKQEQPEIYHPTSQGSNEAPPGFNATQPGHPSAGLALTPETPSRSPTFFEAPPQAQALQSPTATHHAFTSSNVPARTFVQGVGPGNVPNPAPPAVDGIDRPDVHAHPRLFTPPPLPVRVKFEDPAQFETSTRAQKSHEEQSTGRARRQVSSYPRVQSFGLDC